VQCTKNGVAVHHIAKTPGSRLSRLTDYGGGPRPSCRETPDRNCLVPSRFRRESRRGAARQNVLLRLTRRVRQSEQEPDFAPLSQRTSLPTASVRFPAKPSVEVRHEASIQATSSGLRDYPRREDTHAPASVQSPAIGQLDMPVVRPKAVGLPVPRRGSVRPASAHPPGDPCLSAAPRSCRSPRVAPAPAIGRSETKRLAVPPAGRA